MDEYSMKIIKPGKCYYYLKDGSTGIEYNYLEEVSVSCRGTIKYTFGLGGGKYVSATGPVSHNIEDIKTHLIGKLKIQVDEINKRIDSLSKVGE